MHAIRQDARTVQHPHQVLRMRTMDFVSRAAAELREAMLSKIALGRFGTLGEISALACSLASEEGSFSTGAVYDASGGRATY